MNSYTPLLYDNNANNHYNSGSATNFRRSSHGGDDDADEYDVTILSLATPAATRRNTLSRVPSEITEHLLSVHQRQTTATARDENPCGADGAPKSVGGDAASEDSDGGVFGVIHLTFSNFKVRLLRTPPLRLLSVLGLVLLLISGNSMQVIFLNMWLAQYPADNAPGNYTTFAVSSFLFSSFFLMVLSLHILLYRPDLRFTKEKRGWLWLLLAGWLDTLNSSLTVYAASHTPAILQALFTALVPVYAAIFTKLFLKDLRSYHNNWIRSSFTLIIAGVLIASITNFGDDDSEASRTSSEATAHSGSNSGSSGSCKSGSSLGGGGSTAPHRQKDSAFDQKAWAFLFFISVPVTVLLNVTQTLYMTRYTYDPEFLAYTAQLQVASDPVPRIEAHAKTEEQEDEGERGEQGEHRPHYCEHRSVLSPEREHHRPLQPSGTSPTGVPPPVSPVVAAAAAAHASFHYGNDTTVKLVMLTTETMVQALLTLMMLPVDAMPWYGSSRNLQEAWQNFMSGLHCLIYCPNNFLCCWLYSCGFVFVYLGAAYLNQYSVTLCSMVSQMGGPTTAILLLVFPVLNVTGDMAPWYWSALAIFIMVVGTFIYVLWDSKTEKEKIESELLLKMRMFNLCDDEEVREVEAEVRHGRHRRDHSSRSSATRRQLQNPQEAEAGEEEECKPTNL